jgi:hypothetical protein
MPAHEDFSHHNSSYVASFGDNGKLPLPPAKKLVVGEQQLTILGELNQQLMVSVTCMDARVE